MYRYHTYIVQSEKKIVVFHHPRWRQRPYCLQIARGVVTDNCWILSCDYSKYTDMITENSNMMLKIVYFCIFIEKKSIRKNYPFITCLAETATVCPYKWQIAVISFILQYNIMKNNLRPGDKL